MRQIYHRQNNRRKRSHYNIIIIIIIIVVIIEVSFHPISSVGNGMNSIFSNPIGSLGKGITSVFKVATGRGGELLEENSNLRSEIDRLNKEIRARDLLRNENNSLRQICRIDNEEEINFIISEVIARPPKTPYDTLKINKGYNDNIIEGRKVYANDYYIGFIETTNPQQSTVSLIGNEGEVSVVIEGSEGILTPLKGLAFVGDFSSTAEIKEGDTVVLVDDMDNPFATVTYIEESVNDPSIKVYVNVPVQLSSLRYVAIEK